MVNIFKSVYEKIMQHAKTDLHNELGGILLGKYDEQNNVSIEDIIIANKVENGPMHIKFTHDSWQGIYEQFDNRNDDLKIVGWYHTHPGIGVFLSSMDRFIVENFFNASYHLSLVVDPIKEEMGIFSYREKIISKQEYSILDMQNNAKGEKL